MSDVESVDVTILPTASCWSSYASLYRSRGQPPRDLLCAAGVSVGRDMVGDSCQGDSGGGLVVEQDGVWQLAGVVAGGVGCGRPDFPGLYVDVRQHLDWIGQFM